MNPIVRKLTLCTLLGASMSAQAAQVLFPNGDFETAGGANWGVSPANGSFAFPATGGNPNGYAEMGSSQAGGYAVLISNNDQPYPLASLGLVAGKTYTFSYDMIASVAGANKGGVKVESWSATGVISDSNDQRVTAASTGWATYTYDYTIAATATHIKIVPLWTPNETVGFDNIKVNNTPVVLPPIVPVVPNGDFEIPGGPMNVGASWHYYSDGFPAAHQTTGGNPGGNVVIDGTGAGGYGVLVGFNNTEKTLASLGLTPGETYTFQMDMKVISGPNVGGLKLEGPAGYVYENRPAKIGDGSQWATYSFVVTFPPTLSQFKIVPLWGIGSQVAYDNVKILLPTPPGPLQASIATGAAVSWTAASAVNRYQPQESVDNSTWTNLGAPFVGNTVSSAFDSTVAPYYRVLESVPAVQEAVYNRGFEEDDGFDVFAAEGWARVQSQPAERIITDARTGLASMRIKVKNVASEANGSEVQQNTKNVLDPVNGQITPGNTYNFSFWAKQISSGVSYVQQYKVSWLDDGGAIKGDGGVKGFTAPLSGTWTQITQTGLVAPSGATTALIQILGVTGAVAGDSGEVLIDDVSLVSSGFGVPNVPALAAATLPAVEISWPSKTGQSYQVQSSGDLSTWSNFTGVITGDNSVKAVYDTMENPKKFYKVGEIP